MPVTAASSKLKPGIHYDVPPDDYHKFRAISRSFLCTHDEDPQLAYQQHITGEIDGDDDNRSTQFGRGVEEHFWGGGILEIPEEILAKNGATSTNAYRDWAAEHPGKIFIKPDKFVAGKTTAGTLSMWALKQCEAQVEACPRAERLLFGEDCIHWPMLVWEDKETGLLCKAQPDVLGRLITDLKTAVSINPKKFSASAYRFGYHRQNAMYQDAMQELTGEKPPPFGFVVLKNSPSFAVAMYTLTEDFIERGRRENRASLRDVASNFDRGVWQLPGYGEILDLGEPRWAKYDNEYQLEE